MKEWAAMGCNGMIFEGLPLTEILMKEWAVRVALLRN